MAKITGIGNNPVIPGRILIKADYDVLYNALTELPADTTEWGTKKRIATVLVYNTAPTSAGTVTVSLAAYVPAGTKAVTVDVSWTTAAAGRRMIIQDVASSGRQVIVTTQVADLINYGTGDVPLNSSYQLDTNASAAATVFELRINAVYL